MTKPKNHKSIRLPPDLHQKLKVLAALQGKTLEEVVIARCTKDLDRDMEKAKPPPKD